METLLVGASYGGSAWHSGLNYGLLLIVLFPNLLDKRRSWLVLLIGFSLLQAGLWFVLQATGISLIWCALAGYNLWRYGRAQRPRFSSATFLLAFSLGASLVLILYYALNFPFITTVAHGLALALGYTLARPLKKLDRP